jgi:hypothetical protein
MVNVMCARASLLSLLHSQSVAMGDDCNIQEFVTSAPLVQDWVS